MKYLRHFLEQHMGEKHLPLDGDRVGEMHPELAKILMGHKPMAESDGHLEDHGEHNEELPDEHEYLKDIKKGKKSGYSKGKVAKGSHLDDEDCY